jgi:lipoyl(octanoyl) transferase
MSDLQSGRDAALRRPVGAARRPYHSQSHLPEVRWLGRLDFPDALALQDEIVACKRQGPDAPDEILLLEHEPVYTIGRTPDQSSLLGAAHLPHPVFAINRGGQATYHGPGQLIGYPIIDLRRCGQDLHRYLRWLEQTLIDFLATYKISATRREGLTGVWVEQRKIASIGVGVRHWITMHGFALNVCGDLSPFAHIVPCGISNVTMTSVEKEAGKSISVIDLAREFEKTIREAWHGLLAHVPSAEMPMPH